MKCVKMENNWGRLNNLALPLACRTNLEQIRERYKENGEEQLSLVHKTDWSNQIYEICTLLSLWLLEPLERDVVIAKNAFEHGGVNYKALVEIYCGRKSSHLLMIKQLYKTKFGRQLEQDIINVEPPSPYQRILIALATSHKSHHADISQHIAKCDARRLYETGEGSPGSIEESVVLAIFSKRSIPQLNTTFFVYKQIYGHDYTKSLRRTICGEFVDTLKIVVQCLYTPSKYYAKMLYGSIKGRVADKSALVRVIMRRADTDMDDIRSIFKTKYGMELKDAICEGVPRGDCRDFLSTLASSRSP